MERIRELRKLRKISMKELGAIVGVAESTMSLYETGKHEPDMSTLQKIAQYFNVSIDYLLGNDSAITEISPNSIVINDEEERDLIMCFRSVTREAKDALISNAHSAVMFYRSDKK